MADDNDDKRPADARDVQPARGNRAVPSLPGAGALALPRSEAVAGQQQLDVNELLRILSKWKWLILGIVVACVLLSVVVTLAMTHIYKATTTIEINAQPLQVMGSQQEATTPSQNDSQFLLTQLGLLRSRALADRVARTLDLGSDDSFAGGATRDARDDSAASRLVGNLNVVPAPGSDLIEISYTDENPERAARIVNTFTASFIAMSLERRYNATAYARAFLQTRLAAIRTRLEQTERQLVEYAQKQGILELGESSGSQPANDSLAAQSLTSLNQALAQATTERITAEQRYREAKTSRTTEQVMNNPVVQQLRTQRAQLQAQYDQKLSTFKPDYPEMLALKAQMNTVDASVRQETSNVSGTLASAYQEAVSREGQLRGQVAALRGSVLDLRSRGIQYNILQRDVDTNRALYDALLQRYKEIGVAGGIGESEASVVDPARQPHSPFRPNALLNLGVGIALGLVLGFAAAFGIEFVDDTIKSPEDVINKLKIPVLGLVPKLPKDSSLTDELADRRSEIAEAYFSILTALQFVGSNGIPRSLLISSSRAAEGKTSTALSLAQSLARVGGSVLLIDADLRKPSFKGDIAPGRGLSSLLTSTQSIDEHIVSTYVDNLSLLTVGAIPPNPAELLATPRMGMILREALDRFDIVVVDGPPVLGLADSPNLSALCEGTVMVIEAGGVRRPVVLNSLSRLAAANARVLGTVLNKYNPKTAGSYGYGYGYGYGSNERYGDQAEKLPQIDLVS